MSGKRVGRAAAILLLLLICTSCGDVYRPVATPVVPPPPNPGFAHIAVVVSGNGPNDPGAGTTIDVSGDSAVGEAKLGLMPGHAGLVANGSTVYVANRLDDTISSFSIFSPTTSTTISLPPGSSPAFVHTTEFSTAYVANSGNGTVSAINTLLNVVSATITVGVNPVALSETPNGQKLYVVNEGTSGVAGSGSVSSINTPDRSVNPPVASGSWTTPVWAVARSDSGRVYVLDAGTGLVSAIDTATDAVVASVSVGAGANYMIYDKGRNRVYVTNTPGNSVSVLDVSTDTLTAKTVTVANPLSVAALPDGSRFYVAGATVSGGTVTSQVTVFDASSYAASKTIALTSVPQICTPNTPVELSMAAAADSTRVYVGNCDAGNTAIIRTTPNNSPGSSAPQDTLVLNLPAPVSAQSPSSPGGTPPPQNPVFVLAGP